MPARARDVHGAWWAGQSVTVDTRQACPENTSNPSLSTGENCCRYRTDVNKPCADKVGGPLMHTVNQHSCRFGLWMFSIKRPLLSMLTESSIHFRSLVLAYLICPMCKRPTLSLKVPGILFLIYR